MATETHLKTRHVQKHDIEENWIKAINFIPKQGEIIVYDDRYIDDNDVEHIVADKIRYKIGDGVTNVNNLSFMNNDSAMISTTHAELKELRDSGSLIPGVFYRITDYICTTTQTGTQAMDHKFDIIVQALSNSTLSEIAKADYHYNAEGSADGYFATSVTRLELHPVYYINEDEENSPEPFDYRPDDVFIEYGHEDNYEGETVPALYKTDMRSFPEETDYEDVCYYVGTYDLDGVIYDKWRKIDNDYPWESSSKKFVLTDVIVKDGDFDQDALKKYTVDKSQKISNLNAWELKYCLDNDTARFPWVNSSIGTGVIYYLKDEGHNECSYDFKNILFTRVLEDTTYHLYTFSFIDGGEVLDISMLSNVTHHNHIASCGSSLNNIVLVQTSTEESMENCSCDNNIFERDCYDITLFDSCCNNRFEKDCNNITLGMYCEGNIFKHGCNNNILSYRCTQNTFENACFNNDLAYECSNNMFKYQCSSIELNHSSSHNTFGAQCRNISFTDAQGGTAGLINSIIGDRCYDLHIRSSQSFWGDYVVIENIVFGSDISSRLVKGVTNFSTHEASSTTVILD